jgi:hypothetical protein
MAVDTRARPHPCLSGEVGELSADGQRIPVLDAIDPPAPWEIKRRRELDSQLLANHAGSAANLPPEAGGPNLWMAS